jgi:dCTP deaminase
MTRSSGVLAMQNLYVFMEAGFISGVNRSFVNPASIDMPLSDEAYRLETIALPRTQEPIRKLMKCLGATRHDMKNPLEKGVPYLIRAEGSWSLPSHIYGYANPKSSSGRVNLFCRGVADGVEMYDKIGYGDAGGKKEWKGEVWVLVRADSFPILLHPGIAVSQMRLFSGQAFISELEGDMAVKKHGLIFSERHEKLSATTMRKHKDSLMVTIDVGEDLGWECRGEEKVLDFSKLNHYEPDDFFTRISPKDGMFKLRKNSFYILSTLERIMVPPYLSAELRAIDPRFGLYETHRAGFIDPGWGWNGGSGSGVKSSTGKGSNGTGRPITLEVTAYEEMGIRHGQAIARIRYEHMVEVPTQNYDSVASNYTEQEGPKLSKHFKS